MDVTYLSLSLSPPSLSLSHRACSVVSLYCIFLLFSILLLFMCRPLPSSSYRPSPLLLFLLLSPSCSVRHSRLKRLPSKRKPHVGQDPSQCRRCGSSHIHDPLYPACICALLQQYCIGSLLQLKSGSAVSSGALGSGIFRAVETFPRSGMSLALQTLPEGGLEGLRTLPGSLRSRSQSHTVVPAALAAT